MAWPPVLIVMALSVESQGIFERAGVPVLFSGLGKVNATLALTRRLAEYRAAGSTAAARASTSAAPVAAILRPERSWPAAASSSGTWT